MKVYFNPSIRILTESGFGDHRILKLSCSAPPGYVDNRLDCNDLDAEIYPSAPELCDGIDNDCNGQIDEIGTEQLTIFLSGY